MGDSWKEECADFFFLLSAGVGVRNRKTFSFSSENRGGVPLGQISSWELGQSLLRADPASSSIARRPFR